jgi:methionyl-tRNA formyltransferase
MAHIQRVLFVGHDTAGSHYLLKKILAARPSIHWAMIVTDGLYYRKTFLSSVKKLLLESSLIFCAVRALDVWRYKISGDTIERYCRREKIECHKTFDVNGESALRFARDFSPDLIVSLYTMHIYKKPILSIPRLGAIGSHPSILPNYRGLEVFFWAMANGETEIGSSVFYLSERLDDGLVIREKLLPLPVSYSMMQTYWLITEAAAELLTEATYDIENENLNLRKPDGKGSYFPMPTRSAVRRFRARGKKFF